MSTPLTFDQWAELYKNDQQLFEQLRKAEIESVISSAPVEHQHRLRQLQWRLDGIHQTREPLQATIEMSKMMGESVVKLEDALKTLKSEMDSLP